MALLASQIGERARVLVVGAGAGSEVVTFGAGMPHWAVTGVDPSRQMLQQARFRVWQLKMEDRVSLHEGFVADLPEDPPHDAATLLFVMQYLPDDGAKQAMLEAIARRVRPGGPLALVDLAGTPGSAEFAGMTDAWMRYARHRGLDVDEQDTYTDQLRSSVHYASEGRIQDLLAAAGFERVAPFYRALLFGGWTAVRGNA
jgi:tRNA (cmo5U34)-methyltransferase